MKHLLLAVALVVAGATAATAAPARDGIRAVISAQIEAFGARDFAQAFSFASDGIRAIFGTADTFAQMVETGYGMVIAPAEVQYRDLRETGGALTQRVLIRDPAGLWHALDDRMIQKGGAWRIGGVERLGDPAVGA